MILILCLASYVPDDLDKGLEIPTPARPWRQEAPFLNFSETGHLPLTRLHFIVVFLAFSLDFTTISLTIELNQRRIRYRIASDPVRGVKVTGP